MSSAPRVLVVDDEPQILRFLRTSLGANGYHVLEAATGAEALRRFSAEAPDVIVLDLGLPDLDGKELIRLIREGSAVPIVVLSARAREAEKIEALDLGADDYVNKPFGIGELMARLRAALRHRLQQAGEVAHWSLDGLTVDLARRQVKRNGQPVRLTPTEYELLAVLVQHAGKVVTHRQLLQAVWGPAHLEDVAYLRVFVGQLRRKIEGEPGEPALLLTEPGVGYRLRDE
jgi:two-component system, OmpR family, KDP operon response regulator KdpE